MIGQGYDDKFDSMGRLKPYYLYWSVGQAIVNKEWRERNGDDWRCIRIEVTEEGDDFPCEEMSVFYKEDSDDFPDWVDGLVSRGCAYTVDEIVRIYRQDPRRRIEIMSPGGGS